MGVRTYGNTVFQVVVQRDRCLDQNKYHSVETILLLQDGYYEMPKALLNKLNECAELTAIDPATEINDRLLKFDYVKWQSKCEILVHSGGVSHLELSPNLAGVLGFEKTNLTTEVNNCDPKQTKNIQWIKIRGSMVMRMTMIFNLWVYTNIVSANIVGHIEAPLLRIVPLHGDHWTYQSTSFTDIQYLPVSRSSAKDGHGVYTQ